MSITLRITVRTFLCITSKSFDAVIYERRRTIFYTNVNKNRRQVKHLWAPPKSAFGSSTTTLSYYVLNECDFWFITELWLINSWLWLVIVHSFSIAPRLGPQCKSQGYINALDLIRNNFYETKQKSRIIVDKGVLPQGGRGEVVTLDCFLTQQSLQDFVVSQ